jgi:MFS transporter, DHA1 family, multidrug resistance protein
MAVFKAVPMVFIDKRGWGLGPDGLAFIAIGLGSCIAVGLNFSFSARYASLIEKWKGFPPPEERLYGAMVGGPCLVIGVLLFGWTGQYPSIHWFAPASGMILVGISVSLIFASLSAYLVDVYLWVMSNIFR